jgi:GxxExxY protein
VSAPIACPPCERGGAAHGRPRHKAGTGLVVEQQRGITVTYKGALVGDYFVDLLVEDAALIELKTVPALDRAHRAQCINYLRATGRHLCLLLNFGTPRLEFQRVVQNL